jgi:ADP-ribose pyrophosphatase YjhB (NUDIX family)/predicted transcriptional regulator
MSHQVEIHSIQTIILQHLLFVPEAAYATLFKQVGLSNDNFNFHLKSLVKLGYVAKKSNGHYALTAIGKEHANKLDTDTSTIERQPKVTVLLNIIRESNGELEVLVQQRLKQPFYGFWGRPSGKIRWGETIIQTAHRELNEETGLTCDDIQLYGLYHKIDRDQQTGHILEDKIFFETLCLNPQGELIEKFPGGLNKFCNQSQLADLELAFEGIDRPITELLMHNFKVRENQHYYTPEQY